MSAQPLPLPAPPLTGEKPALLALKDYEAQQAQGRAEPLFDPRPLGIKNADLWEKIADKRKRAA